MRLACTHTLTPTLYKESNVIQSEVVQKRTLLVCIAGTPQIPHTLHTLRSSTECDTSLQYFPGTRTGTTCATMPQSVLITLWSGEDACHINHLLGVSKSCYKAHKCWVTQYYSGLYFSSSSIQLFHFILKLSFLLVDKWVFYILTRLFVYNCRSTSNSVVNKIPEMESVHP